MLARLEMGLQDSGSLTYPMSSLFHGVLMGQIPQEYASHLHDSRLHPYTQHLERRGQGWYWIVNTLNQEAVAKILYHGLVPMREIYLQKHGLRISICSKELEECSFEKLAGYFYQMRGGRYIQLHFITPTAFKQQGKYLFYPDIRCIYQSLMNKYDAAAKDEAMCDEETLEELCKNTKIKHYDLKSTWFHLEGVRIPSFIGKVTFKLGGTQTMVSFANMLFRFGLFSGVGIKTALGMGAFRIMEDSCVKKSKTAFE